VKTLSGEIQYDDQYGHVCTCTAFVDDVAYAPHTTYQPTVSVVRDEESPTESGSYWYQCSRCGAGGWSGC
jgi:hypothetical protein